jgi:hypothetical protein
LIKKRIIFLLLTAWLVFPVLTYSQVSRAADKSWNSFWKQFSAAVNRKNRAALKGLMASEKDFSSGGGSENRNEWLNLLEKRNWWSLLQKSVRLGTKPYEDGSKPSRVTKDNHLVFVFIGGRWRFVGPMGD